MINFIKASHFFKFYKESPIIPDHSRNIADAEPNNKLNYKDVENIKIKKIKHKNIKKKNYIN